MSGIDEYPASARAVLFCDKCGERWESALYEVRQWRDRVRACEPAWSLGWRVFRGKRSQHTYCGAHGPNVDMRQVFPEPHDVEHPAPTGPGATEGRNTP